MNIQINQKDDIVLKILHYFITEEDYKPVIINGVENEIWLENMENDLKLIRINTNYIHNAEQLKNDTYKAQVIMKSIKRNTFSFKMNMLNILIDTGDTVKVVDTKNIETIKIDKINDFKKNKFINEFFPKVKDIVETEKVDPVEFFRLTEDMNEKTIKNEKKLQKIFSPKKPIMTYIMIAINVIVFILTFIFGADALRILLADNCDFVVSGQIYRLFTSMFLHVDYWHILMNMYALFVLGPVVEKYYGKTKFTLIYLISGIIGNLFSCVFMDGYTLSYGASGAIFGLLGSIAYFTYYYRATLQGLLRSNILPTILLNLALGFIIPGIDIFAHIGGLIGGIFVTMAIGIGDKGRNQDRINGIILTIILIAAMGYILFTK